MLARATNLSAAWQVLGAALLAQVAVSVVDQGLPVLTGYIKTDLKLSAAAAGLAVSTFGFGKIFGSYAAGVAADRLDERRLLMAGAISVGCLVTFAAASPTPFLFGLLAAAGLASSTATPAGGRLVLLAFPRERHGLALGVRQTGIPLGGLISAALLPLIAGVWNWRWALATAGCIAILGAVPLRALRGVLTTYPLARGSAATAGKPLLNRNVVLLIVWGCLVVTGQYATIAFFALDLNQSAHLSLAAGSLLVALANACGIIGRIAWGTFSDRALAHGRKPLLLTLNVAGIAAAALMLATPRSAPWEVFIPVAAAMGFALIGYQGLFITMIAESAGPRRVGATTGLAVTFVQCAISATLPLFGLVADAAGSYRAIWAVLLGLLLLALGVAAAITETDEATAGEAP